MMLAFFYVQHTFINLLKNCIKLSFPDIGSVLLEIWQEKTTRKKTSKTIKKLSLIY